MNVRLRVDIVAAALVQANAALLVQEAVAVVAQGLAQVAQGLVLHHAPEDVNLVVPELVRGLVQEPQLVRAILAANSACSIVAMAVLIRVTNFVTRLVTTHVMLLAIVHVIIQTVRIITVVDVMELVIIHVEHSANRIVLELVILLVKDQRPDNC